MMAKNSKKNELKFYQKLILNNYLLKKFGADSFKDISESIKSPLCEEISNDGTTGFYEKLKNKYMLISKEKLQEYDLNIVSHLEKINYKREDKIKLKYFQYLSLLFVEYYLDMYFNHRKELLKELKNFLHDFNMQYPKDILDDYEEKDLNKIALWNATGSGKTLLMHINYHQYKHYSNKLEDGASFILLTPKEGLSKQHIEDFSYSNIPAEIYNKALSRGLTYNKDTIQIIENTKLADKDGEKTVATSRFGNKNVVFVDEGHRGSSGNTWNKYRNELCEDGFSFEYSATFGQAVAGNNELLNEYAKCIIFDYSYKYFYSDGYGKDYNILNLQEDEKNVSLRKTYLTAALVSFYQQKKIFTEKKQDCLKFNIDNPLMIFVGSSVNAVKKEKGKEVSDVVDIVSFYNDFIKNRNESINNIKKVMEHTTGIIDSQTRDIFRNSFEYLEELNLKPEYIFDDILKIVFNCNTKSSVLHIDNMKGIDGEILLRLGENEPFGLINVGDDNKLMKLFDKDYRFFKTHRSCIVNLDNIVSFDISNNIIRFKDKEINLVSRSNKRILKDKLTDKYKVFK